jgi:integrase
MIADFCRLSIPAYMWFGELLANIERRVASTGEVTFRVKVRLRGHRQVSATFDGLTKAKRWAQQTEAAIRDRRYFRTAAAEKHTLGDVVDRFIDNELLNYQKMIRMLRAHLQWWKSQLGHMLLVDLTPAEIVDARDRLLRSGTSDGRKITPATVNRYHASLSIALSKAVNEWGWLEDNPLRKVGKLREPKGRDRFLSDDERDALLKACKSSSNRYLYTIVVLAISTAARRGELLGLRWRDIDLKQGIMSLRVTKNGDPRSVPLRNLALELIGQLGKVRRIDSDLVFPSDKDPQKPIEFRDPWNRAVKQAGLRNFRFHDLRHTAASYLAMSGASAVELAAVLGHRTLQMVKRYAHLSQSHTSQLVERMNEKIFG